MEHNGTNHGLLSVNPAQVYMARQEGARGGWARKQLDEQTVKNICIMTYLFHILSQLWIPIHIVTPTASVQCFPSATRCQDVSQDMLGNFGDDKNRQEQVEHDRVGCRSLGVILPQRRLGMWQTAELLWRGKNTRGSPGRTSVLGLNTHQTQFCFTPLDPAALQPGGCWATCGGFTVLPNLSKPHHVIRDKDRGLGYSTSILPVSHKAAHPWPPEEPNHTATTLAPVCTS